MDAERLSCLLVIIRVSPLITDLTITTDSGNTIGRRLVAPLASGIEPLPLISGTEPFTDNWLVDWHSRTHDWPKADIACYSFQNAVVSGTGQVWLEGELITSTEVMPLYVAKGLGVGGGSSDPLTVVQALPIRVIETPCLVGVGHGTRVYGHFLTELLLRVLVARRAQRETGIRYSVLLDHVAPDWLLRIFDQHLDVPISDIEFFRPTEERVLLRHAIVPTTAARGDAYHPATNDILTEFLDRLAIPRPTKPVSRVFVARNAYTNPSAPSRRCTNEDRLIQAAVNEYGFTPVTIENMHWPGQIALFRDADIILGVAGSGLHNAIFSKPGSRLASIGIMNLVQSMIGGLRGQLNAFLSLNIKPAGEFAVEEQRYRQFLDIVCA